jgi:hypothetical protein
VSLFGDVIGYINGGRAAKSVSDANIAAEHGVLGAVSGANSGITDAVTRGYGDVNAAGANVTGAANTANAGLEATRGNINTNLNSYLQSGAQGNAALQSYAASNPQFSFNLQDYFNSPAYQFQLQQGQDAITNKAAAMGLGASGNTLKDLTTFGQGLASTYYNQAFNQAQSQFQTNQNTTLANIEALLQSGQFGTGQFNSTNTAISGQQGANTIGAANTNANLQTTLAGLGLQGAETEGANSITGSRLAGDYAVGAGQAHAGGIMAEGNNLTAGVGDLASLLSSLGVGG